MQCRMPTTTTVRAPAAAFDAVTPLCVPRTLTELVVVSSLTDGRPHIRRTAAPCCFAPLVPLLLPLGGPVATHTHGRQAPGCDARVAALLCRLDTGQEPRAACVEFRRRVRSKGLLVMSAASQPATAPAAAVVTLDCHKQGARRRGTQWYPTTHARRRARATRNNRPAALLLHPPMCTELVGCPPGPTTRRRHVSCGGGGTIALSTLLAPATSAVSSPRAHTPRRGNTAGPQRQATVRTHGVTHLYPSITLRQRQQQTQQQVVATTTAAANDLRL